MSAQLNNLYSTWGDGFVNAISDFYLPSGQDAYEVVIAAFGRELTLANFHALGADDFIRLSDAANAWLEIDRVEPSHMREAVEYLCRHWPLAGQQD